MGWDFSISRTIDVLARTAPFIVFRILVYAGVVLAYVIATGGGAGIGWGIGAIGDPDFQSSAVFWGGVIGFGLVSGILYFAREWFLYMLKAGHIAVLVEILDGRPVPDSRSQISHAAAVVRERFVAANVLFGIDQLVKGVIGIITGIVSTLAALLPIPGLEALARFVRTVIRVAVGFVDEIILAHIIRTEAANPYAAAQDALILYAQNAKAIIRNAIWLAIFSWGLGLVLFLVFLAPAAAIVYVFPGDLSGFGFVFAIILAIAFKAAVIEPFVMAALMQVFFSVTAGQTPREDWRGRLEEASDKFRELGERARGHTRGRGAPATATGG